MIGQKRLEEIYNYTQEHGEEKTAEYYGIGVPSIRRYINLYKEKNNIFPVVEEKIIVQDVNVRSEEEARDYGSISADYSVHRIDYNFKPDGTTQCKFAFVPKKGIGEISFEEVEEKYKNLLSSYKCPTPIKFLQAASDFLLTVSLFDFHHGKMIYGKEAGTQDYGIEESKYEFSKYMGYVLNIINTIPERRVNEIVLEIGGDFFNSNSADNATKKGTAQAEDARYIETEEYAEEMFIDAVNLLSPYTNYIRIVVAPGNHDTDRLVVFARFLNAWFRNNDNIIIDYSPAAHKVYTVGKIMLMYTHKFQPNLVNMMAHLDPIAFATCTTKIINVGHLHYKKDMIIKSEYEDAIEIVQHPSLIPGDAWSIENAYLSKRQGLIRLFNTNIGKIADYNYEPHFVKNN